MLVEPGPEEGRHFVGQPDRQEEGAFGPGLRGGLDDMLDLVVGDPGDDRGDRDDGRDSGLAQRLDGRQPLPARRRPGFQGTRDFRRERSHRYGDPGKTLFSHSRQDIRVANDPVRFGGDRHRVLRFSEHLQHRTGDPPLGFDRLVGIGIGPDRHRPDDVAGPGKLLAQDLRRVRLGEQLRLEVEAGRQIVKGVGRPGEAMDAAMLAQGASINHAPSH